MRRYAYLLCVCVHEIACGFVWVNVSVKKKTPSVYSSLCSRLSHLSPCGSDVGIVLLVFTAFLQHSLWGSVIKKHFCVHLLALDYFLTGVLCSLLTGDLLVLSNYLPVYLFIYIRVHSFIC